MFAFIYLCAYTLTVLTFLKINDQKPNFRVYYQESQINHSDLFSINDQNLNVSVNLSKKGK